MAEQTVRKTGRLKRLWPGRVAAPPPASRPPRGTDSPAVLPPRTLTAAELIAMARQARAAAERPLPARSADVF